MSNLVWPPSLPWFEQEVSSHLDYPMILWFCAFAFFFHYVAWLCNYITLYASYLCIVAESLQSLLFVLSTAANLFSVENFQKPKAILITLISKFLFQILCGNLKYMFILIPATMECWWMALSTEVSKDVIQHYENWLCIPALAFKSEYTSNCANCGGS